MSTIVLTGASDGIGRAAAIALAREGHQLVLVGRNPSKVADVVAAAEAAGGRDVVGLVADFAELAQVALRVRDAVIAFEVQREGAAAEARWQHWVRLDPTRPEWEGARSYAAVG